MATEIWPPSNLDGFKVRIHRAAARDIGPQRALSSVDKDIMHDTEGGFGGDEIELTRDDSKIASCHALIGRTPEQGIVAMVPLNWTAWTPGNDAFARASINLELSGFASTGYTEYQYQAAAAYHRWAVSQGCPIPAAYIGRTGKPGILGHQDVPNPYQPGQFGGASGHTDPGPLFDWGKFVSLCKDVPDRTTQGTNIPPKFYETNPDGKSVGPGVMAKATEWGLTILTNEQFFVADTNQPGLGKMSRTYVRDANMRTYVIMASEQPELAEPGKDTPWKVEQFAFIR